VEASNQKELAGSSLSLKMLAVAHLVAAPHVLAVWIGIQGLPYGELWEPWPAWSLPLLALSLAGGGVGAIALLKWKKWGAYALAASWVLLWALLLLNFPSSGFVVSAVFTVVGYVMLVRPIWRQLA
jgi:hypothetical protein